MLALANEPIVIKPLSFYISGIKDERPEKALFAQLVFKSTETTIADLQGGTVAALGKYFNRNLPKDKSQIPVVITVKEFKLTETLKPDGNVAGTVQLSLSFGLEKDYGIVNLLDNAGNVNYTRPLADTAAIERTLRKILVGRLTHFNNWMQTNKDSNRKLAKVVHITFTNYMEQPEGDTIYYSSNRPLRWDDFQSKSNDAGGKFDAEIMPSIGYDFKAEMAKGVLNVNIALKAYVPKSACWAGGLRDTYVLNHEQRHFDIVKIIAEQFKQTIQKEPLTPDDFEGFINMQYLQSFRDMNTMQKQYDKETRHGIDHSAQEKWNDKIDKELKAIAI